jgi:hypothetical protein
MFIKVYLKFQNSTECTSASLDINLNIVSMMVLSFENKYLEIFYRTLTLIHILEQDVDYNQQTSSYFRLDTFLNRQIELKLS